jgi:hypothetical protein
MKEIKEMKEETYREHLKNKIKRIKASAGKDPTLEYALAAYTQGLKTDNSFAFHFMSSHRCLGLKQFGTKRSPTHTHTLRQLPPGRLGRAC